MNTAVQLRPSGPGRASLAYGTPREERRGRLGPIAIFGPGALVAYELKSLRRTRLFVFRTLIADDRLAAAVPGVRPRVQLLLDVHSPGCVRLARVLLAHVRRHRLEDALSDGFFARAGVALRGRLPSHEVLLRLLSPSLLR
jgi:hypothetical protein